MADGYADSPSLAVIQERSIAYCVSRPFNVIFLLALARHKKTSKL